MPGAGSQNIFTFRTRKAVLGFFHLCQDRQKHLVRQQKGEKRRAPPSPTVLTGANLSLSSPHPRAFLPELLLRQDRTLGLDQNSCFWPAALPTVNHHAVAAWQNYYN